MARCVVAFAPGKVSVSDRVSGSASGPTVTSINVSKVALSLAENESCHGIDNSC